MKTALVAALWALMAVEVGAQNYIPHEVAKSNYHGVQYECVAFLQKILNSPKWDGRSKPPLEPSRAKELAVRKLNASIEHKDPIYPTAPKWIVVETQLKEVALTPHWYYRIECSPFVSGHASPFKVVVFVYLDGEVDAIRRVGTAGN